MEESSIKQSRGE